MKLKKISDWPEGWKAYFGVCVAGLVLFIIAEIYMYIRTGQFSMPPSYSEQNHEKELFYNDVKSIRHSAILIDTIFMHVLDSTSIYYMNPYILEQAKEQNKLIIEHINNY